MQAKRGVLAGGPDERVDAEAETAGDDGDCGTFNILSYLLLSRNRFRDGRGPNVAGVMIAIGIRSGGEGGGGRGGELGALTQRIDFDGDGLDALADALRDGVGWRSVD